MASRKEEKERLRKAREEAERQADRDQRRKLWFGYLVAGALTAAVVAGIVFVIVAGEDGGGGGGVDGNAAIDLQTGFTFDGVEPDEREGTAIAVGLAAGTSLDDAAEAAGCRVRRDLRDEGAEHLVPGAPLPDYRTNPPTSGNHSPEQLADGAYSTPPSPLNYVHSLEHGRVEYQYNPDLPEADQLAIKGVFDDDPNGVLLFPNPELNAAVSATAWRNLMKCDTFEGEETLAALLAFRTEFRGRGPEAVGF
ncbi:MAG: DUF3105 domain-containing protein [Solirubrobacterales bacterium]